MAIMLKGAIFIKFKVITFGCKVNLYESENIKESLISKGYEYENDESTVDIVIINSCTVTSMSDKKVRTEIHRIRKLNPDAVLVLAGCFPQAFPEKAKLIGADILAGTNNKKNIPEFIQSYLSDKIVKEEIIPYNKDIKFEITENTEFEDKTRAFVKIQDGCNQFCSYCIIPYARGRIRSKPIDVLKHEVKILAEAGHSEIVLVGINLAFYGVDLGLRLVDAVEACCEINSVKRIRLGSIEPEVISDNDIDRLKKCKKFCPQFHLSLQSGCDRTLKSMNRKYSTQEYRTLAEKLKNSFENCALTTDIMVGFPGESDADFEESCRFAETIEFSKIHVFPYSRRSGTAADRMQDQVTDRVKTERAKKMNSISDKLQKKFLQAQVGKTFEVLFEKENCTEFHQGYAPNYTLVKISAGKDDKSLRRSIFYVKIIKAFENFCFGEIVD